MRVIVLYIIVALCSSKNSLGQDFEGIKKINGANLYLKVTGKGEPIIVLHGGPGMNHTYLLPYIESLSKNYRVILYDQRASGRSATPSPDSISMRFFAGDIDAIRKEFGYEKIVVLGHSWGALLAVHYATLYPDRIKSMILCNPTPLSKEYDAEMAAMRAKQFTKQDSIDRAAVGLSAEFTEGKASAVQKLLVISFRHSFGDRANLAKLRVEVPENYMKASRALFTGLGKELSAYNYYDSVKRFTFPVTVLGGEHDVIPKKAVTRIKENLPSAQLQWLQKSGHFIYLEEPEAFENAVRKFIK